MSARPLPAHWSQPHGLGQARVAAQEALYAAFKAERPSERAARQKALVGAFHEAQAASGAYDKGQSGGVSGEAGDGLAFFATSPTKTPKPAGSFSITSDGALEFTALQARVARLSRAVKFACKSHRGATDNWPVAFYRLSHRPGEKPAPKDVSRFLDCVRQWLRRKWGCKTFRYAWVAELQTDRARAGDLGAVHYHIAIWMPPELRRKANEKHWLKGDGAHVLPKPDAKGWWKKGSTNRQWVRKSVVAYMATYISKGSEGGQFAKGQRIFGAGGFSASERVVRSHWMLPAWLREKVKPEDRCKRLPAGVWTYEDGQRGCGGGWVSQLTGETYQSPWKLVSLGRVIRIVRKELCTSSDATTAPNCALVSA